MILELVPGRKYYGPHATGWVVLRNGYPVLHVTGQNAKRDALSFVANITTKEQP